ncbi:MAG: prepilin-type N-terminal cleavage/methylation domain-containing protein [Candidatus Omnitrophota bacterium]
MKHKLLSKKGFSMVEMMVTVVITAVCLVVALRVFSVCALAISNSYNTSYAVKALDSMMAELREKAISEDGLETGEYEKTFKYGGRSFTVTQTISEWTSSVISDLVEEGTVEIYGGLEGALPDLTVLPMTEVELRAEWGEGSRKGHMTLKTILPGKKDEYEM